MIIFKKCSLTFLKIFIRETVNFLFKNEEFFVKISKNSSCKNVYNLHVCLINCGFWRGQPCCWNVKNWIVFFCFWNPVSEWSTFCIVFISNIKLSKYLNKLIKQKFNHFQTTPKDLWPAASINVNHHLEKLNKESKVKGQKNNWLLNKLWMVCDLKFWTKTL